jgi:hypothetical protein
MDIRQLVETKANYECCGALTTASGTSVLSLKADFPAAVIFD